MPDLDSPDWKSFWDLATPLRAAAVLFELYGNGAVEAAADAAAEARADRREDDARFWVAVYARLHAVDCRRAEAALNRCHLCPPVLVWPD